MTKCFRRATFNPGLKREMVFPTAWIMDGKIDCEDSVDEIESNWLQCGSGIAKRYVEKLFTCRDVFLCDANDAIGKFVNFEELCDKVPSCGKENKVCEKAKSVVSTWDVVLGDVYKRLPHCLHGLNNLSLLAGSCTSLIFEGPDKGILGASTFDVVIPSTTMDCRHVYGESYVYSSCLGNARKRPVH
jgi:hypothetical protein